MRSVCFRDFLVWAFCLAIAGAPLAARAETLTSTSDKAEASSETPLAVARVPLSPSWVIASAAQGWAQSRTNTSPIPRASLHMGETPAGGLLVLFGNAVKIEALSHHRIDGRVSLLDADAVMRQSAVTAPAKPPSTRQR
jgi:hypothetical protein